MKRRACRPRGSISIRPASARTFATTPALSRSPWHSCARSKPPAPASERLPRLRARIEQEGPGRPHRPPRHRPSAHPRLQRPRHRPRPLGRRLARLTDARAGRQRRAHVSPPLARRVPAPLPRASRPLRALDNLLLLQEYMPTDPASGTVHIEFLGGELFYAMRVASHGAFNLCPSEICNPADGAAS
jgi:hypothetical protein